MSRFEAFQDNDYESSDCAASCCESEHSCLNKGGCAELDITSEESLSFSLQDASCEELAELGLSPQRHPSDVGTTVFQEFLLCFDERDPLRQQRALMNSPSSASYTSQLQHLKDLHAFKAHQLQVRRNVNTKVVSLPQFLWQPDAGLCGWHSDGPTNFRREEELLSFDEEEDQLNDSGEESEPSLALLNDNEPLLGPASRRSSLGESDTCTLEGGTLEDPRYVPRPSSTTSGLREMSKFFRSLSSPEDTLEKKHSWEIERRPSRPAPVVTPPRRTQTEGNGQATAQSTPVSTHSVADPVSSKTYAYGMATPTLGRFLQRRSRSEIKGWTSTSVVSALQSAALNSSSATPLQRSRTEENLHVRSHSEGGGNIKTKGKSSLKNIMHVRSASEDGDKKSKSSLRSFLRRTRLPSFRKSRVSSQCSLGNNRLLGDKATPAGNLEHESRESSADHVASILANLEASLNKQKGRLAHYHSKPPSVPAPPKDEPLSTQGSGETHSDGSSLFGGIESDDDSDSYCSDDADSFFATPYYANQNRWRNKGVTPSPDPATKSLFGQPQRPYTALQDTHGDSDYDTPSMLSSRMVLTRCSSVDTAKASNLSCDPGADRARLLEIQAYLLQQQREREKRLNAPPIEFEAGGNVISVTSCETIDAACEIEVLPKTELQHGQQEKLEKDLPQDEDDEDGDSEEDSESDDDITLPSTAAEF